MLLNINEQLLSDPKMDKGVSRARPTIITHTPHRTPQVLCLPLAAHLLFLFVRPVDN